MSTFTKRPLSEAETTEKAAHRCEWVVPSRTFELAAVVTHPTGVAHAAVDDVRVPDRVVRDVRPNKDSPIPLGRRLGHRKTLPVSGTR